MNIGETVRVTVFEPLEEETVNEDVPQEEPQTERELVDATTGR